MLLIAAARECETCPAGAQDMLAPELPRVRRGWGDGHRHRRDDHVGLPLKAQGQAGAIRAA